MHIHIYDIYSETPLSGRGISDWPFHLEKFLIIQIPWFNQPKFKKRIFDQVLSYIIFHYQAYQALPLPDLALKLIQ